MPYILPERRKQLDYDLWRAESPGELNYCITQIVNNYLAGAGAKYQTFNDIIGALECAKLEIYRRMISPYEDTKLLENGDVYPIEMVKP